VALLDLKEESESGVFASHARPERTRSKKPYVAMAAAAAILLGGAAWW